MPFAVANLITALFANMQTLKFKSHLHNCVFFFQTHKTDRNPLIANRELLNPLK